MEICPLVIPRFNIILVYYGLLMLEQSTSLESEQVQEDSGRHYLIPREELRSTSRKHVQLVQNPLVL